jgi:hypothetical protein
VTEIEAVKREINEAIVRRLSADGRAPSQLFGVASTAIAEVLADMIFAAAKSEDHGYDLLRMLLGVVRSRWDVLAKRHS